MNQDGRRILRGRCNVRVDLVKWKTYSSSCLVPIVEFEQDVSGGQKPTHPDPSRPMKLTRFLNDLAQRPSNENPYDLAGDSDLSKPKAFGMSSLPSSSLLNDRTSTIPSNAADQNPESNSFEYIETLLESLAVLGKLGTGLDAIAQRLPVEVFSLIEITVEEVRERSEFGKRASVTPLALPSGGRPSSMYIFAPTKQSHADVAGALRLTALEAHSRRVDREPLKDLFWTLYSKFDAVLQGLRVVYEVSNRIGSVRLTGPCLQAPNPN